MVGFATDDDADGNQCVKLFGRGKVHQRDGDFKRAGYGGDGNVFVCHAQFLEGAAADFEHFAADFVGEACLYDADAEVFAVEVGGDGVHWVSFGIRRFRNAV